MALTGFAEDLSLPGRVRMAIVYVATRHHLRWVDKLWDDVLFPTRYDGDDLPSGAEALRRSVDAVAAEFIGAERINH